MEIRGKSISYSCFKKRERDKEEKDLITKIEQLEHSQTPDKVLLFNEAKDQLNIIRKEKMKGYLIRARAKNIDENEKPTKYFCKLESYNYTSKIIPSIEKDDGTLITEQDKILEEAKSYYEKLFTSKDKYHIDINLEEELDGCELKNQCGFIGCYECYYLS